MKRWLLILPVIALALSGCTESQRQTLDNVAQDVNTVSTNGQAILDGPLGQMVPKKAQDPMAIGLAIAGAVATAWQTYRRKQTAETLRSVATGIEKASPQTQTEVKAKIGDAMAASSMSTTAQKQIVTKAKA